ncbi:MAG: PorP/SprF family type IX secretion system membrane protein [Bacteroidetes bacterium]|nr:PorP/SprF family type IX secretion system membrane protein [Bacteroidota bacterium]HET6244455.1 PorP/SprF family type IX secretion system membrane protein [Bacteroidia bacterium]
MKINIFFTAAFLLLCQAAKSQDFHLSQYDAATLYSNPALTGMYLGDKKTDYRIYGDFRQQWRSLGKPFNTGYLAYDRVHKRYGIGGYIINNRAGNSSFNNLNFMLSGAYQIMDDPTEKHFLSAGLQLGVFQKSFNPQSMLFDNQYSSTADGGFDPGLSSGEYFDRTSLLKLDGNLGIYYKYRDEEKKVKPFGGFSIYHFTMPNESFTAQKSRMPMRFVFSAGSDITINNEISVSPLVLFMMQAKATELNIGALAYYKLKDTEYDIIFGLGYRNKDAIIIHAGVKQGANVYRISYDINSSYLGAYTGRRGAFEISAIYSGVISRIAKTSI